MQAALMRIDSPDAIYGEQRFHQKFPPDFKGLFAASDKSALNDFVDRSRGPFVSQRGSFTFEQDAAHQWLNNVDLSYGDTAEQVNQVRRAAKRIGSISIDAFAIFYSAGEFVGFWIEASEGEKKRVVASEVEDEGFTALPEEFEFTAPWLAKVISSYF